MSNLQNHLSNALTVNEAERVDESIILSAIVCSACIGYAFKGLLETDFMKSVGAGIGAMFAGLGQLFGLGAKKDDKDSKDSKDSKDDKMDLKALLKKKPDDLTGKEKAFLKQAANDPELRDELSNNDLKKISDVTGVKIENFDNDSDDSKEDKEPPMEAMLALAAKANENEKDPKKKAENDSLIDIISTSCYDKDGNPIPKEEREAKLKETVGEENWESFSKAMANMQKNIDNDAFKSELEKAQKELKPEDAQKMLEDQKERAKKAHERIANEKAEQKKLDDEIADLQKQIEEKSKDSVMKDDANPEVEELKKKIKDAQDKKAELVNNSTLGKAAPDVAKAINDRDKEKNGVDVTSKKDETGKDGEGDKEPKKDDGDEPKEPKKDETGKDDETKKKLDDAEAKWKEREADFEKKWEKKLEDAESEEDKEKVMDEYDKAKKRLKAAKNKDLDSIDDADEHDTEKDATKKGKYKVKEEEITDPKTGEKIKVTTYTGPRGGKFYYPDGKPKKPENKVYVHENVTYRITPFNRLRRYLLEQLNLK